MEPTQGRSEELTWEEFLERAAFVLQAPIAASLASALDFPWVRSAILEGLAFAERCEEAAVESREYIDDRWAEIEFDVAERRSERRSPAERKARWRSRQENLPESWGVPSLISADLIDGFAKFNEIARMLTEDAIDLQLLVPVGFGAIALRQFLTKGLQLDDIPWYVLAWYAFDSFIKLNLREN